ncbi:MAG: hypothetical protein WC119_02045 [Synergistaceae bacterium]
MSSSSSTLYCLQPDCVGAACANFYNWYIEGVELDETNNGLIYVRFNIFGSTQQVELYKDPSYFFLIAIGQKVGAGSVTLEERNDSNITGSVYWDGTLTDFSNVALLHCAELSSSSSSSSLDSSSSSSATSSSESSGSSYCCISPYCDGEACAYFSNWTFSGMRDYNTDNCKLYIGLEMYSPTVQQIRIYKDNSFSELVAIGEGASGSITLSEVSSSGLSGSVTWNGTPVYYPSYILLDCETFSSSSSSSSSSIDSSSTSSVDSSSSSSSSLDSSSSSSSSSFGISSSSTISSSSESSLTSNSSSSSSSIDSSSTSSESVLNSSSSSSSSIDFFWNRGKPLILANSVVSTSIIKNRLAQTVTIETSTYSIGKVYCYLYGPYGYDQSYNIYFGLYTCKDNGEPDTLIKLASLPGSEITSDNWYSFEFNVSGSTPLNQYLSFVMWQDGGDENNYSMWAYGSYEFDSSSSENEEIAWISNDAITWIEDKYTIRSLRIVGDFDAFNLEEGQVDTVPASVVDKPLYFGERDPTYIETKLNDDNDLVLSYAPLSISFVIDGSGSMGWNDRFENRKDIMTRMINQIYDFYPSDFIFDFVRFGAKVAQSSSINSQMGSVATINLDANNPTRSTYEFTSVSFVALHEGDVYSHNDNTYTIKKSNPRTKTVICWGSGLPLDEGTLTRVSGLGNEHINFESYGNAALSDQIISCGFRRLEDGHTYTIGELKLDNDIIFSSDKVDNWTLYYPDGESPSISLGENGPRETEAIDIIATTNTIARKIFANSPVVQSYITTSVSEGDSSVKVEDGSLFANESIIDLIDGDNISTQHTITSIDGNTINFSPSAKIDINDKLSGQGRAESSGSKYAITLFGTTLQLLVKDAQVTDTSEEVIFFLQTIDGGEMEWDFTPHEDWIYSNLFYIDETAILPMDVFDTDGIAFPDGTKIVLEVDVQQSLASLLSLLTKASALIRDALVGDTKIYVESTEDYEVGMTINIVSTAYDQVAMIQEIDSEGDLNYIVITEPLIHNFYISQSAKIVIDDKSDLTLSKNAAVSISLPIVDVTPVETGESLDPSLLLPYDPPPISPPSDPDDEEEKLLIYDGLNNNRDVIQRGAIDLPTINGFSYVRVLPITDDVLTSDVEKNSIAEILLQGKPPAVYPEQTEVQEGDFDSVDTPSLAIQDESNDTSGIDYVIETPVYLYGGHAESSMTTTTTEFEQKTFVGYNIPGVPVPLSLFVRDYTIFPHIREETVTGALSGIQYFNSFEVNFANPVKIHSIMGDNQVDFYCEIINEDDLGCSTPSGYEKQSLYGVHAGEGPITIDYVVANKGILVRDGYLNITIYSSTTLDQEAWACNYGQGNQSREYLNVIYPPKLETIDGEQIETEVLSTIDKWRNLVAENPSSELIESIGETDSDDNHGIQELVRDRIDETLGTYYSSLEGALASVSGEGDYDFYTDALAWTVANQYEVSTIQIPIVNGKASLSIPSNETVASIFVEASYPIDGTIYESIRADMIMVRNPLMIGELSPYSTLPSGNPEDRYELGGTVTWKDGSSGIIEDSTTVNYALSTPASPTMSNTDDGWAGGVFMGPKNLVTVELDPAALCPPPPIKETVTVEIVHSSGWRNILTRNIYWENNIVDDKTSYFKVSDGTTSWADGESNPPSTIISDLNDGFNETPLWVGENGVAALQGLGQPDGLSRLVFGSANGISPIFVRWNRGIVEFYHKGLNKNIGNKPSTSEHTYPWDIEVYLSTSYYWDDESIWLMGLTDLPYPDPSGEGLIYPRPVFRLNEPLAISLEIENDFKRDGYTSGNVVAKVTWKGKPITNKVTLNEGQDNETIIDYPMPFVYFESGICTKENSADARGTSGCCSDYDSHPDAQISSYAVQVSLARTDQKTIGSINHSHSITVDASGNGLTTSTVYYGTFVTDHTHTIDNFIVGYQEFDGANNHNHSLESIAEVNILPTTSNIDISVIGVVEYDPTYCLPYTGSKSPIGERYPKSGNRMMFDSVTSSVKKIETETYPELTISLLPSPNGTAGIPTYYTAETPFDTAKGFNYVAEAYFTPYIDEHGDYIPKRPVDDGSRINVEFEVYLPYDPLEGFNGDVGNVVVSGPDIVRNMMRVKANASISTEGEYAEVSREFAVDSVLGWLPDVRALVTDPTNDIIYVSNAITNTKTIGASAIYDATRYAARRLLKYQESNPEIADYKKAVILLTDGDENSSQYSINQAITSVSLMQQDMETPIIPVALGQTHSADQVVLSKMYIETNGFMVSSPDIESATINDLVDYIFTNHNWIVGIGTYRNSASLNQPSIPKSLFLTDVIKPDNSKIEFRYRTSDDKKIWSVWSSWLKNTEIHEVAEILDSKTSYFEYEIRLSGNEIFETPTVEEDMTIRYYKPNDFAIFFNPVSVGGGSSYGVNTTSGSGSESSRYGVEEGKRFISSIHVTHEADIPPTSTIRYGITQSDANDVNTFYSLIDADQQTIILTRYNEPLITYDYRVYEAINGNWPAKVKISIYRINSLYPNGILVDPSEYASNYIEGTITFYASQSKEDEFVICVEVYPSFRLVCEVKNYGSKRAIVHHIGVVYNMMKRIPTNANGTIIHTPIDSRIS